ncbi:glutathione synthetase [Klebsiella variicola]|nr:glutathione synthetase [Klebsiella variicola]
MIKLGIVMDPIATINIKKDTSFAMLLEAQRRGYELHYMEMNDLYLINGEARARTRTLSVEQNYDKWYDFTGEQDLPLADLDVILMRKDPPFDTEFIYATYILERAEEKGTLIVNKPQSLRDCNEKLFTAWFSELTPETLVTRNKAQLKAFWEKTRRYHYETARRHGRCLYFPRQSRRSEPWRDHGDPDRARQPLLHGAELSARD